MAITKLCLKLKGWHCCYKMAALWFRTMFNCNPPIAHCHPLLWGGGILVDHWSTISSLLWCIKFELNWNWKKMNWIWIELKDSESDLNLNWIELENPKSSLNWNWIELKEMNWSEPCLQLIWRSGTRRWNLRVSDIENKWVVVTWFKHLFC